MPYVHQPLLGDVLSAPCLHSFHWEPEHTAHSNAAWADFTRRAGIGGHRRHGSQDKSAAHHQVELGTGWKRNSLICAVTLPRSQVCLLTSIPWVHSFSYHCDIPPSSPELSWVTPPRTFLLLFQACPFYIWLKLLPWCPCTSQTGPATSSPQKRSDQPFSSVWTQSLLVAVGRTAHILHQSISSKFLSRVHSLVMLKAFQQDWSCL